MPKPIGTVMKAKTQTEHERSAGHGRKVFNVEGYSILLLADDNNFCRRGTQKIQLCEMKFNFKLIETTAAAVAEREHFHNYFFHSREIRDISPSTTGWNFYVCSGTREFENFPFFSLLHIILSEKTTRGKLTSAPNLISLVESTQKNNFYVFINNISNSNKTIRERDG